MLDALANGSNVDTGKLTTGAYLDGWLSGKAGLRDSTLRSYEGHIRIHIKPALGHVKLADLRHAHVSTLFAALRASGTLTPSTIKRVHATLNSAMNDAVRRQMRTTNPAAYVELEGSDRRPMSVWKPSELAHFLTITSGDRLAVLYYLVAFTGLRRGEAAGLRWSDLDLDVGRLSVRQQLVQLGYEVRVGKPKTRTGERTLSLDERTVARLRDHSVVQAAERLAWGQPSRPDGLVFTRPDGDFLHPEYVTRHFQRLAKQAGLPAIRLHDYADVRVMPTSAADRLACKAM